jgi:hypothetical protein
MHWMRRPTLFESLAALLRLEALRRVEIMGIGATILNVIRDPLSQSTLLRCSCRGIANLYTV